MQLQREEFTVYRWLLTSKRWLIYSLLAYLLIYAFYISVLRINYWHSVSYVSFAQCMDRYYEFAQPQQSHFSNKTYLTRLIPTTQLNASACNITKQINPKGGFSIYSDEYLQFLPEKVKAEREIHEVVVRFNINDLVPPTLLWYFGQTCILIDQLAVELTRKNIDKVMLRSRETGQIFAVKNTAPSNWFYGLLIKFWALVCITYRLIISSCFCGILATSLLILVKSALNTFQTLCLPSVNLGYVYVQEHLNAISVQPSREYMKKYILVGFVMVSLVLSFGISGFMSFISGSMVGTYSSDLNFWGLVYFTFLEFCSILFVRTQTSIKFAPHLSLFFYRICYYIKEIYPYRLPQFYVQLPFCLGVGVLLLFAVQIQSLMLDQDDQSPFKPTYDRPRLSFFPVYNIGWHYALPPLWTYFVPQFPRSYFTPNELSYVDSNHDVLYGQLTYMTSHEDIGVP